LEQTSNTTPAKYTTSKPHFNNYNQQTHKNNPNPKHNPKNNPHKKTPKKNSTTTTITKKE
jgi:hypothetical protein